MYWIAIKTAPRREKWAKENVEESGNRTFLPMFREAEYEKPQTLFPSYLFVLIKNEQWYHLKTVMGVSSIVMSGENPAKVPDREMHYLLGSVNDKGLIELPQLDAMGLQMGQAINVDEGPFQSFVGVYDGMTGPQRIRVLVDWLGRKTPLDLDVRQVSAVPKEAPIKMRRRAKQKARRRAQGAV